MGEEPEVVEEETEDWCEVAAMANTTMNPEVVADFPPGLEPVGSSSRPRE